METHLISDPVLAASITQAASKQTYYTIRFLVDDWLVDDAYRAYAYFRWVDDWLDDGTPHSPASANTRCLISSEIHRPAAAKRSIKGSILSVNPMDFASSRTLNVPQTSSPAA